MVRSPTEAFGDDGVFGYKDLSQRRRGTEVGLPFYKKVFSVALRQKHLDGSVIRG